MKNHFEWIALAGICSLLVGCHDRPAASHPAPKTPVAQTPAIESPVVKQPVPLSTEALAIARNQENGFYTILLLHNGEDTTALHSALSPLAKKVEKCKLFIAMTDDAGLDDLLKLDMATAPTPVAYVIAPNNVVTGTFMKPPAETAFQEAILPEQPLAVKTALLDKKNVIVKLQSAKTKGNTETDNAVEEFLADPKNAGNYVAVAVDLDTPANSLFIKQLKIDPATETHSVLIGMAPPFKLVNKPFRGGAKKSDVVTAVNPACGSGCAGGT